MTMELVIKGKNMKVNDRTRDYVEKRAGKLDRYLPDIQVVQVDLSVEQTRSSQDRHVAQITVRSERGPVLRSEERAEDLTVAVDAALDKINRQIARFKGKRESRWHGHPPPEMDPELLPLSDEDLDELEEEQQRQIVRTKRFMVSPMNEDEAIEQMELLGHDFFVFFNPDSGLLNVLYRRHDGNYGLLEPQIG